MPFYRKFFRSIEKTSSSLQNDVQLAEWKTHSNECCNNNQSTSESKYYSFGLGLKIDSFEKINNSAR